MILSRSGSRQVLGLMSGILDFGGVIGGILAARLPQPKNLLRRIFLPGILSFLFGDLLMGASLPCATHCNLPQSRRGFSGRRAGRSSL